MPTRSSARAAHAILARAGSAGRPRRWVAYGPLSSTVTSAEWSGLISGEMVLIVWHRKTSQQNMAIYQVDLRGDIPDMPCAIEGPAVGIS
jgi:hypothetical protein